MAIFRQTLVRSTNTTTIEAKQRFRVAVFGDPTLEKASESEMVHEVGKYLNADVFISEDATGEALLAAIKRYNLVHFQGHAEFHSAGILQNSVLKLYGQEISIHSLFEATILQSPHISLLACESGWQEFSAGDEPLGFLTALTIAGAGSVLGTLWQLDDTGASSAFTEHFYKDLGTNIRLGRQGFVFNLALAHQKLFVQCGKGMKRRGCIAGYVCWLLYILIW